MGDYWKKVKVWDNNDPIFGVSPVYWKHWIIYKIDCPLWVDNYSIFTCSKRIKSEWKNIHQNATIDIKKLWSLTLLVYEYF